MIYTLHVESLSPDRNTGVSRCWQMLQTGGLWYLKDLDAPLYTVFTKLLFVLIINSGCFITIININMHLNNEKLVPWGTDGRLPLSDLDLGSGHTAYRRASLIDLYIHIKFHWDRKKKIFEGHHWGFGQVQSHVTQKLEQISKIRPDQI